MKNKTYILKRVLDIFLSIFFILLLLIPMVIIYLLIFFFDCKYPIYFSSRVGIDNKLFLMPKFRTMAINTPQLSSDKIRKKDITKIGKYLRLSSLDELPQLFLVLNGKMSLVGPRPALFNQKNLISMRKKFNIHKMKTGITGYAQINGRDELTLKEKLKYDIYYSKHISLSLDLLILFKTFFKVIGFKNIKN